MLVPPVVGLRLTGDLKEGTTATDLVLTIAELLRHHGVVGKFVEVHGTGLAHLPLESRATIGNMAPEYGATCVIFPVDGVTLDYLRFTGRDDEQVALVEAYTKEQGLFRAPGDEAPVFSESVELDLSTVEPSLAGPARPQDRVSLSGAKAGFVKAVDGAREKAGDRGGRRTAGATLEDGSTVEIGDGTVVIAAITSCTNTSNPQVMLAAGLLAQKAVARGLQSKPWVKTSLAPGSRVVMDYYERAGLVEPLSALGFELVGFGCTTCIGNSGPLLPGVSEAVGEGDLSVGAVLSGNRNFEGRIHPDVRLNYLASPPLVVAYALAGTMDIDLTSEPLGTDRDGSPVYLPRHLALLGRDHRGPAAGPSPRRCSGSATARSSRATTSGGPWPSAAATPSAGRPIPPTSCKRPSSPRRGRSRRPCPTSWGPGCWPSWATRVTTDHISPAGSIRPSSPAGQYLIEHGVEPSEFNSYGARRGNHEVMMRGTFANVRLRNLLAPGTEGGVTRHLPDGTEMSHLRGGHGLPSRRGAPGRLRRGRIRLGIVAGLGGQGTAATRRPGRGGGRATRGSTGRTWWGWGSSRSSSPTGTAWPASV